jgi:hypothetical protein
MKWIPFLLWLIVLSCSSIVLSKVVFLTAHSKYYIDKQDQATNDIEIKFIKTQIDSTKINHIRQSKVFFSRIINNIDTLTIYLIIIIILSFFGTIIEFIRIIKPKD